ncbi:hypothetical protein [Hymenobacter busanensis]|uniref:hypothetical protein n=1 Tax=Hymenobacter busanensis TaxID=2607656 RepID=UPI0013670ED3|nr:hypothetical protein [Hymenobacter busanensis]QHJ06629.1 hypothetical protein GUY19_04650 [Hymenobacter busanensis]
MKHVRIGSWLRIVGLPVLLVLLVAFGPGCYYETNDDVVITLLLRGRTAVAPVTNLHLYFHGWAALLAWLYTQWPAVPWYGLLLYALLTLALVLLFAFLDRLLLRAVPQTPWRTALLVLFFFAAFLEHVLWFNYLRVPVLLAGSAVLFAAQRARSPKWPWVVAFLCLTAAWAIRPSGALLGVVAVAPAAGWLVGRRGLGIAAVAFGLCVSGAAVLAFISTPDAARYRRLDVLKSNFNDYHLTRPAPRTAADSLGVSMVQEWLLADSIIVNEALFARALPVDAPYFATHTAPEKLLMVVTQLARDYFLVLLLNLGLVVVGRRHAQPPPYWGLLLTGILALLLALGIGLKLPPRVALPLLTLFTVANAVAVFPTLSLDNFRRQFGAALLLPGLLAVGLYAYKTVHRVQVLQAEQRNRAQTLAAMQARLHSRTLVAVGLENEFKSLSPFLNYDQNAVGHWLLLSGWQSLDPSQAQLRYYLTGTRDQAEALRRLARQPGVYFWLPRTGEAAAVWQHYLRAQGLSHDTGQLRNLYLNR